MAFRPFLLAAAVLPSIVACGGDEGDVNVTPEGPVYKYVANRVLVPATNTQAREYGLDLNGDKTVDNQLGNVLSTLAGMGGFDIQSTIDKSVAVGDILLLADFQTRDFTNTTAAGVTIKLGDSDMVTPPACNVGETYNETTNTGCAHHLTGTGTFVVKSTPQTVPLGGRIVNGTFTGGPGDLSLQIALGGTDAIQLDLIGARAKGSSLSEAGLGSGTSGGIIFAGAITKTDIDGKVIPAIQEQLVELLAGDCPNPMLPPLKTCAGGTNAGMVCTANTGCPGSACTECGCDPDSTGKTVLGLFDTKLADGSAGKDCQISVDEIKTNNLIVSLLSPDVTINGKEALSIGIKATAVPATY